jgi:hypothetical protein
MRTLAVIIACISIVSTNAVAQVRFRVAAGLSTDWITSDNPAVFRLASSQNAVPEETYGGAFDGAQMGWGLRGYIDLDKQKKFRIPVGLDYFMYKGAQSIVGETYSIRLTHENALTAALAGFEWSFVEFPWAFARAYVGAEARMLFVGANTITRDSKTLVADSIVQRVEVFNGKAATSRLGAMARLGIEGEIYYPVFVNTSVGWGAMNLLGRDTRSTANGGRGELLTPVSQNESGEGVLYHLNFTFMVQVRL